MKQLTVLAFCAVTLGAVFAPAGHAQVVTNGNFATGDFTGWTTTASDPLAYTSVTTLPDASGNVAAIGAYFGSGLPDATNVIYGSVAQTLTTVVGQQYTVSFLYGELNVTPSYEDPTVSLGDLACCYLDPDKITSSNNPTDQLTNPPDVWAQNDNLDVSWGGSTVYADSNFFTSAQPDISTDPDGGENVGDYFLQPETLTLTATSTSTLLEFDANDYQQNVILTDVSVDPIPEPGTLGLLGSAVAGLALLARRRRRQLSA